MDAAEMLALDGTRDVSGLDRQSTPDVAVRAHEPTKRLSASWYVVMASRELGREPTAVTLFDRQLVAWRDASGRPTIMDRFCAHLGANLADGKIVNGVLQCPFHAWTYDAQGRCTHVPSDGLEKKRLEPIPASARQRVYPVEERYGYIWAWYGSADPLHPLPPFPKHEDSSSEYTFLRFAFDTSTSVLRIVENFYDAQHANPVHGLPIRAFTLRSGPEASSEEWRPLERVGAWFGSGIDFKVDRYFGLMGMVSRLLGVQMSEMNLQFDGYPAGCVMSVSLDHDLKYKLLQSVTPVRDGETVMHMLIAIRKRARWAQRLFDVVLYGMQTRIAAGYDVAIWNGMRPDGGGAYSKYDRLVLKYRGFYHSWVKRVEAEAPGACSLAARG